MCNAEVKNVSDRAVRAVTFGVLLHGSAPNHSEPILASSREMQTDIKPGGVRTLDVLDLTVKEVQVTATQLKSDRVIAEFGILGVQFNDGGSWIFDLQKNGGFSTSAVSASADPAATMRCKPTISSGLVALLDKVLPPLAVVLAQGYTCAISPNTEVGTNNGDSDEGDRGSGLMVISVPGSNRSVVGAKRRWQLDFVESDQDRQACCC